MTEKNHSNDISSTISDNDLIDDNYSHLVLDKITKELIEINGSKCCDNCPEALVDNSSELSEDYKKYVIAKSKGMLGIHFCENTQSIPLEINDSIIIKNNNEFEFATVIETGQMVKIKRDKTECEENEVVPIIDRRANQKDIERNITNVQNSIDAKSTFISLVRELSLEMKLVDIHYQFDRKKLFFFYTADGRVDFRELAKRLAANFKTRIELRQIGVRDEAKRIGGIATCGREYCCTSFLSNFKRITTDIAVENNISTSIAKYTGPCGKLKCCLSFELDQ